MHLLRLVRSFVRASTQNELTYQMNFWISLIHSLLNFGVGILAVGIVFSQVQQVHGWDFGSTMAVLGVFLTLGALRGLFIGPSLDALAGMDGEVWTGRFDYTLMRPVDVQFQASFRHWQPLALIDLFLGLGVLGVAVVQMGEGLTWMRIASFIVAISAGLVILYAILLAFAGLVFWSPGFLFTWVFDAFFQMARYPVSFYPPWIRFVLTWVIPVGLMTTIPAQALKGELSAPLLLASVMFSMLVLLFVTWLFRTGLRRYASASS